MKNFNTKLLGVCVFVIALASACNHSFDKVVPGSPPAVDGVAKAPKILYIIADGARGTSVKNGVIPNMSALLPNSIYSWNGLSDATTNTTATAWADMVTGVSVSKHLVTNEGFTGNNLAAFPSIFARIKSLRPQLRIASFAASAAFKTNLTGGTDVSELFGSDEAVKTRMVDFLKTDTASLVVGEFAAIETAGKASGFDNTFPAYKDAITKFDAQVGELLAAIKGRANYAKENWMVIIASNRGGAYTLPPAEDDKTVFSNTSTNTFAIIYNANFKTTFVAKPFVGNTYTGVAPRFLGSPQNATARVIDPYLAVGGSSPFNFGASRSFTVSVKIKKHKNPVNQSRGAYYYQWPGFLGKKGAKNYVPASFNPTTGVTTPPTPATAFTGWGDNADAREGWEMCVIQNRWRFYITGNDKTPGAAAGFTNGAEIMGREILDENWHDLTAVVETKADGKRYVRIYTDGVPGITNTNGGTIAVPAVNEFGPLAGTPNFDNNSPLRMGYTPGEIDGDFGKIDVELKEFKVFGTALPANIVAQYACDQTMDRSHPYWDFVIGYWPCNEGIVNGVPSTILNDRGPFRADMTLSSGVTWAPFNDLMCSPPAANFALLVPKNTDIPVQILSWFNIARLSTWTLEGKVWITN